MSVRALNTLGDVLLSVVVKTRESLFVTLDSTGSKKRARTTSRCCITTDGVKPDVHIYKYDKEYTADDIERGAAS